MGARGGTISDAATIRMGLGEMNWQPLRAAGEGQRTSRGHQGNPADGRLNAGRISAPDEVHRALPMQPRPVSLVSPSIRKVVAHPVHPLGNLAFDMGRSSKKAVDGLPTTGGATIPDFDAPPSPYPPASSADGEAEKDIQGDPILDDEEQPLVNGSPPPSPDGFAPPTMSAMMRPFAADKVFARDAFPLHLPHLDAHLASDAIAIGPHFSQAERMCSAAETELYGYHHTSRRRFEVCGAQLKVPVEVAMRQEPLRRRANGADEGPEHELTVLAKEAATEDHVDVSPAMRPSLPWRAYSRVAGSSVSTASRPRSRLDKFPPLMLLEDGSLDELKSNAVGPRKPPGGLLGSIPGVGSILGTIVDFVIGVEGSTLAAGIFRLQLFIDFVQLTNLNLYLVKPETARGSAANKFLLSTLPSLLALDLVSVFGYAVLILAAWVALVAVILVAFWRMTRMYNPNRLVEGFSSQPWLFRPLRRSNKPDQQQQRSPRNSKPTATPPWRSTPWTKFQNVMIVMLLSVLYIPLGKLAFDAVVWNVDYWPLDAQGKATKSDTVQHPGDPSLWRDPLDFCYTTTMRRDQFNWAYVVVSVAALTIISYTLWFPYQMRRTILTLLPRVPEYNELGNKRSKDEIDAEYTKLLQRDSSPLNFMYNAYKREWGNYKPLYLLLFKFSNMLLISVFTQNNCLWRRFEAKTMLITQESVLIAVQTVLLIVHLVVRPFLDEISNRSELVSRSGYVINSILGLLVALQLKDSQLYNTWVLYIVYAFTYSGNIYFSLAGTSWMGHLVKRLQRRIDFSIDIFSPFLRLNKHVKRRVWQETLSTLLLTGREFHMPLNQLVTFSVYDDSPPYLLAFQGTAAERHVENLKILKAIGIDEYRRSVEVLRGEMSEQWKEVMRRIQLEHAGPDAYWKPLNGTGPAGVSSFFGKAFLIPFPPTLVMSYDQNTTEDERLVRLTTLSELEAFVWQNESQVIQRRKWVRALLRALDGQRVYCPHVEAIRYGSRMGSGLRWARGVDERTLAKPVFYSEGLLSIRRREGSMEETYDFHAGFDVSITYDYGQRRDADGLSVDRNKLVLDGATAFGLRDDFEWTTNVQRFVHANNGIVESRLSTMQILLEQYRHAFYTEAREKRNTMSYAFLLDVFEQPVLEVEQLERMFDQSSCSPLVRQLPQAYPATTRLLLERLNHLNQSPIHRWWFLFWDDLWRQNQKDYIALSKHKRTFSPQFPSSVAWTPLPRDRLEALLKSKEGIWSEGGQKAAVFHHGLLNKIYFTLDELASQDCLDCSPVKLGLADKRGTIREASPSHISDNPLSRMTGGGTNHDDGSIMDRHAWPWTEERLGGKARRGFWRRVKRFLALDPYQANSKIDDVWVYARLAQDSSGQWRYEGERRRPQRGPQTGPEPAT